MYVRRTCIYVRKEVYACVWERVQWKTKADHLSYCDWLRSLCMFRKLYEPFLWFPGWTKCLLIMAVLGEVSDWSFLSEISFWEGFLADKLWEVRWRHIYSNKVHQTWLWWVNKSHPEKLDSYPLCNFVLYFWLLSKIVILSVNLLFYFHFFIFIFRLWLVLV